MLPDPLDTLTLADLPNDSLVDVAQACGLRVAAALLRHLPGQHFIVPQNGLARVYSALERAGRPRESVGPEDMPTTTWSYIAQACGVDVALSLLEHAGQIIIVVPKNPCRKLWHRYISEHYDGTNAVQLSIRIGLSRSHFYALLNEPDPYRKKAFKRASDPNQTRLV